MKEIIISTISVILYGITLSTNTDNKTRWVINHSTDSLKIEYIYIKDEIVKNKNGGKTKCKK